MIDVQTQHLFKLYSFEPEKFAEFISSNPGIFMKDENAKNILKMIFTSLCFDMSQPNASLELNHTSSIFEKELAVFQHIIDHNPDLLFKRHYILENNLIEFIFYFPKNLTINNNQTSTKLYNSFLQNILLSWIEFKDKKDIDGTTYLFLKDKNEIQKVLAFIKSNPSEFDLILKEKLISKEYVQSIIEYLNKHPKANIDNSLQTLERHLISEEVSLIDTATEFTRGTYKI